jgi:hypothetical protein
MILCQEAAASSTKEKMRDFILCLTLRKRRVVLCPMGHICVEG